VFEDLQEKVVVVTGAARGIGRRVAEAFGAAGSKVLAADLSEEVLGLTGPDPGPGRWINQRCDVSDQESVAAMVERCLLDLGPPDVLLNIAAISQPRQVMDMSLKHWQRTIETNLNSVFICTKAFLPHMVQRQAGSVISFSSLVAATGGHTSAHYAAAKAGVEGFTRSLALEVGGYGVRVNTVAPGMVETMMLALMPGPQQERLVARTPLRRCGRPDDFVGVCMLLASDAGSYITGQTIHVNGGLYMN